MQPSSVTELLFQHLNFRGEEQKVISTNIANIDTPEFKTKHLKFNEHLDKTNNNDLTLYTTNKNHIAFDDIDMKKINQDFSIEATKGLDEQNDGNNVNLDTQMSKMAQNSMMFSAIQSSIKKDSSWFKSVIDASSKN